MWRETWTPGCGLGRGAAGIGGQISVRGWEWRRPPGCGGLRLGWVRPVRRVLSNRLVATRFLTGARVAWPAWAAISLSAGLPSRRRWDCSHHQRSTRPHRLFPDLAARTGRWVILTDGAHVGCVTLHAAGFAVPRGSPRERCALTAPFHPCLIPAWFPARGHRRFDLCGTFPHSHPASLDVCSSGWGLTHHRVLSCPDVPRRGFAFAGSRRGRRAAPYSQV
jgi:hypothetical protein